MRDFFDYSGQDDDYEVEYDAPVFVFDDEEDDGSGGGYEPRGDRHDRPADTNEYVPDYVSDSNLEESAAKQAASRAAEKQAAEKPAPAKSEEKPKSARKGKAKGLTLGSPAEFEPEPAEPVRKSRPEEDEYEPVFVFDEDLDDEDDVPARPESVGGRRPRESVSGRDAEPGRRTSGGDDGSSGENEFVYMPFLDIKDEPEEENSGKVTLSFSKVKAPKKEKEFVFMPFLNDDAPVYDEEDQSDSKKTFVSSKGTIIDEGLVLIPLESPEEILEEESKESADAAKEDSGISLVGGEQPKMTHAPKPKDGKKKSPSRGKRKGSGKRGQSGQGAASAAAGNPDEQFRAAMNNIDPKLLASVRKDPIQMAALEQAVRIALVQQAAQAAVEKTTGRSFGYIGNYSPTNTPGAAPMAQGGGKPQKKKRSQGLGNAGQVFNPLTSTASAPSEFGIDAQEAARMEAARLEANRMEAARMEAARLEAARRKEVTSIKDMPSMFTPVKEAPPAPSSSAPTFTPGPSAQQDPALAAINAAQNEPLRPEDVMPDVTQDPALAHLKGTYERPENDIPPPSSNASQPSQSPRSTGRISMTSPAAVRAAMRSGNSIDQIAAQNAAKASSSQAAQAAQAASGYEAEAEESGRSGCLIWIIVMFIAFFVGLIAFAVWPALSKEINYRKADTLLADGKYIDAIDGFAALDDYKDSPGKHQEASYDYAKFLMERDYYDSALEYLVNIDPTYADTSELIAKCRYVLGKRHLDAGRYADAYDQLYLIPKYEDAGELAMEANYKAAGELMAEGKYDRAAMRYELFPDYQDSMTKYSECQYNYAQQLFDAGQYDLAYHTYNSLGSYEEAPFFAAVCQYDAMVTGSSYSVEEMQSALNIISANANSHDDAVTILQSHMYDKIKLVGTWELGESFMTFELSDSGNRLVTSFEGYGETTYDNVVFDNDRILTSDGQTLIISIRGFDPSTSAQPRSVDFHAAVSGEDQVFTRR